MLRSWLSEAAIRCWAQPSTFLGPIGDNSRLVILSHDGEEVIVLYTCRDDEPVDVTDLYWVGYVDELLGD